MRNDLTEIIMIVDRSGSMEPLRNDAIGGFNTFLEDQKKQSGQANLTLVLFNDGYDVVVDGKPIQEVSSLNHETYVPQGSTALLDAMGKAINQTGARLAAMDEQDRPGKVIVVVLTDGQENASHEFSKAKIAALVKQQEEQYNWKVIFLSSDMHAIQDAGAYIRPGAVLRHAADAAGTCRSYVAASCAVSHYRATGAVGDLDDNSSSGDANKN